MCMRNRKCAKRPSHSPPVSCLLCFLLFSPYSSSILFTNFTGVWCTIDHLELVMPRYAIRGGDVILKCEHSVPLEHLHKVEWRKGPTKLFQYIKGRKPPFRSFETQGAVLNVSIYILAPFAPLFIILKEN